MSKSIRVVMADDHALVLAGLRSLLAAEPDITLLATATDGERLLDAVRRFDPDVVISDIQMPYMDGITSLEHIRQINPQTRVLLITAFNDAQTVQTVLAAGADGLLLKTAPPEQTIEAIRQVMAGQLIFPAAARRWLSRAKPKASIPLSGRELEVLTEVAKGLTNAEAARRLNITENTVKFHLQNIYQRLQVSNRTEASRWHHNNCT
jgi:DNA-binding NarL/FixJ family response regulator